MAPNGGSGEPASEVLRTAVFLTYFTLALSVFAAPSSDNIPRDPLVPASDAELDAVRGGFILDNGMIINISIDRRVYQNGIETFSSHFESPQDLASLQAGTQNTESQFVDSLLNSIIQNTMDNQLIETISKIDIELRNSAIPNRDLSGQEIFSQFIEPTFR